MRLGTLPLILPFATAFAIGFLSGDADGVSSPSQAHAEQSAEAHGRTVVLIIDSLRPQNVETDLPTLRAYAQAPEHTFLRIETCATNFTLACTRTLLEGRESPASTSLHNISGAAGAPDSIPALARDAGYHVALISDVTLPSLYGAYANESFDTSTVSPRELDHDIEGFRLARRTLATHPDKLALFFHVHGTDAAAHFKGPGTQDYRAHYARVDRELNAFLRELKPTDSVIITGDHGHNDLGDHVRNSVAILAGRPHALWNATREHPLQIAQVDLALYAAYALDVTMPANVSTALPEVQNDADATLYFAREHQVLLNAGYNGEQLGESVQARNDEQAGAPSRKLRRNAPLFVISFLGLLGALIARSSKHAVLVLLGASVCALAPIWLPSIGWTGVIVMLALVALTSEYHERARLVPVAFLLGGLAAFTGRYAPAWRTFFHNTGNTKHNHALYLAVGLVVLIALVHALWRRTHTTEKRVQLGPIGAAAAVSLIVIPSGLYYYHAGQNFVLPLGVAALVWIVYAYARGIRPEKMPILGILGLVLGTVLLKLANAGGWIWKSAFAEWLTPLPVAMNVVLFFVGVAYTQTRASLKGERLTFFICAVGAIAYSCGVAELSLPSLVVVTGGPLLLASAHEVFARMRHPLSVYASSLLLTVVLLAVFWHLVAGFDIAHFDVRFVQKIVNLSGDPFVMFVQAFVLAVLKYALPVGMVYAVHEQCVGERRARVERRLVVWLLAIKMTLLILQTSLAELNRGETLAGLFEADTAFVYLLGVFTLLWSAMRALPRRVRQMRAWTSERNQPSAAAI